MEFKIFYGVTMLGVFFVASAFLRWQVAGSKYSSVCALYAEKEQQCLAAGVACRYTTHIVMLFLISETSLHDGGAQCADNSSGGANVDVFILWLWTFADKTGGYAVFGAVPPILVVGINGVGTDSDNFCAGQLLLIISPSSDCPV